MSSTKKRAGGSVEVDTAAAEQQQQQHVSRAEQKAAKQAVRSSELSDLMQQLNALLEEHDAALDVTIITRIQNGQEVKQIQLGIISR
jgi:hypothetical protein